MSTDHASIQESGEISDEVLEIASSRTGDLSRTVLGRGSPPVQRVG